MVSVTVLNSREYCVILDPVDSNGKPQLGKKKLVQGERTFFLQPGEKLAKGIQAVYVLEEDEGLILRCIEAFKEDGVSFSRLQICVEEDDFRFIESSTKSR